MPIATAAAAVAVAAAARAPHYLLLHDLLNCHRHLHHLHPLHHLQRCPLRHLHHRHYHHPPSCRPSCPLCCLSAPAAIATAANATATPTATAALAYCASMASLRVPAFDHEGRPVQFDTWLDDLQLYLLSNSKDIVSLFDLALGAATAPPTTASIATRSHRMHSFQTAQALYDAVVACYSSPATAALGRLLLPYLFPKLSAFATVEDLDQILSLDPTSLTVDLLEQHLLGAETSAVATSLLLRTSGLLLLVRSTAAARARVDRVVGVAAVVVEVAAGVVVGAAVEVVVAVGLVAGVGALVAAVETTVGVAVVEAVGLVAVALALGVLVLEVAASAAAAASERDPVAPAASIAIFDIDFDAILSAMYALSVSAEGDCYRCVLPDPGIAAAALGASESCTLPGTTPTEALHTFTLDSGSSRYFFRDSTTLTPLPAPVPVRLADPSGGPVVTRSSTVLPCPAVPSGSLSGLHLPSFSTNLVRTAALQDAMVTTTTPGGQRVSICTCTRTGRRLATFTHRPGSSLYTLATEPSQVAVSTQVSTSGQVAAPCLCRLLSHQTLLLHHRLGHPSLPRLRGMHSRLLVSSLPRSLPPLPPSPALPCLPCVEGRQRAAPHSSSFPPMSAPLQTLHMDVWGPARVSGQSRDRYFLLVFGDYTRYTTVFPLRTKGQFVDVLIRTVRLQLRERFRQDLPVLRLHSDRGCEFSSNLSREFCCGEGILESFMLADSPQQNGIAERRIGLVMEVALWGSRTFVRDTSAIKLSPHAMPCVFLGFVRDVPGWQFYHPTSRRVFPSQDVTFDVSVPFYRLPPSLLLAPGPPPLDPLPPEGPAPSSVSQVALSLSEGAESGGAASSGGPAGASPRRSPQQLREWFVRRACLRSGATGARGAGVAGAGGAEVTARVGGTGGTATAGPRGARPRGTGAAGTGGVEGAGAGDPTDPRAVGAGGTGAGVAGGGGTGAAGAGAVDPRAGGAGDTVRPRPEQSGSLTKRREDASRPVSPICTARRIPRSCRPPVLGMHAMTLRPSSVPLPVPLPAHPESSLLEVLDSKSDRARTASPNVSRLLDSAVTDPSFESAAASALVAELLEFASACRLDYASALVAESKSARPPSVGGECALGTDVFEDMQEELECLAPAAAMDAEMASWKSTCTYVNEVPPPGANIIDGMWIFRYSFLAEQPARGDLAAPPTWLHWVVSRWTTLAALGFAPSTADPLLFLRTDTSLPPLYVLVYVLQRFGFQFSSPQPTPLSTSHSLLAPPSDESIEPSGPYPELVGCLITLGMGLVLGGRGPVFLTGHAEAFWVDDSATQRSSEGYTFSLGSGSISWQSTRLSLVLKTSCEAEIYAGVMAA
ncbi:unnamed protein product [Closterium sp. NIES-53]